MEIGKQNKVVKKKIASRAPLSKMRITLNAEQQQLTSLQLYVPSRSRLRGESGIHHREGGKDGAEKKTNFRFRSVFNIFFSFSYYPSRSGVSM